MASGCVSTAKASNRSACRPVCGATGMDRLSRARVKSFVKEMAWRWRA